jgi:nitrogen fixation NifU-like protein
MDSASCIDDIYVYIKVKDDVIEDVAFDGIGCAISMSTASIMTELLKGLKRDKALYIIEQYKNMLLEKPFDESVLDEAIVFINTHKQASRIKCATLAWDGAETLLTEDKHE